jgi:hypothetical protein
VSNYRHLVRQLHVVYRDPRTHRLLATHSSELDAEDVAAKEQLGVLGAAALQLGQLIDALHDEDDLIETPRPDGEVIRRAMSPQPEARA